MFLICLLKKPMKAGKSQGIYKHTVLMRVLCQEPQLMLFKCGFRSKVIKSFNYVLAMDILTKEMEHLHGPCLTPLQPPCKIPLCPDKTDLCHCACELRNFLWQKVVGPHSGHWLFLGVSEEAGAPVKSLCTFMWSWWRSPTGVAPYPHPRVGK